MTGVLNAHLEATLRSSAPNPRLRQQFKTANLTTVSALSPNPITLSIQSPHTRPTFKMGLEAVMIVVDNSESSRNGDYTPTRFEAQSDAVSLIFSAITQANPESSVGLMSMGGKGPEVLVTLTTDHGKILEGLHRTKTKIRGSSHLATGIQIAGVSIPIHFLRP